MTAASITCQRSRGTTTRRRVAENDLWGVSSRYLPHEAREDRGYRGTMTRRSRLFRPDLDVAPPARSAWTSRC
jgi:hypothetical protein